MRQPMTEVPKNLISQQIFDWLLSFNETELYPQKEIIALNFGIYESPEGFVLYVIGSRNYDEDNSDWACMPADYNPNTNYLTVSNKDLDWENFQDLVINTLKNYLANSDVPQDIFSRVKHIITGFDDGDLVVIK